VKKIKLKTLVEMKCNSKKTLLSHTAQLSQVKAVEQKMQIESSEQIMESLSNEELQIAAELFLYLNACPDEWFKSWTSFYNELFLTQSADQIMLTLNRMTKTHISQSKDSNVRAEKLLEKTAGLLSLKLGEIQGLSTEKEFDKISKNSNGTHYLVIFTTICF